MDSGAYLDTPTAADRTITAHESARPALALWATGFDCGFDHPVFSRHATEIPIDPDMDGPRFRPLAELALFRAVLRAGWSGQPLLIYTSRGRFKPELLAAIALSLLPYGMRPPVVVYGEVLSPDGSALRKWAIRLLHGLLDRVVSHFNIYAEDEAAIYTGTWGVPAEKVRKVPYFIHGATHDGSVPEPARHGPVFMGGNTNRDYGPVMIAAARMPEVRFIVRTSRPPPGPMPLNVEWGQVPRDAYVAAMREASAVIVPIRQCKRRVAGMLTYLEAMWLRKLVIVPAALGVHEYIEHGRTGLVVDGTPDSYVAAIAWAMDPANAETVTAMTNAAHDTVRSRFTLDAHVAALMSVMKDATQSAIDRGWSPRATVDGRMERR